MLGISFHYLIHPKSQFSGCLLDWTVIDSAQVSKQRRFRQLCHIAPSLAHVLHVSIFQQS